MTQARGPHELSFVVRVPESGTVRSHEEFDVYLPVDAGGPLPVVIFVPGPVPARFPVRPRHWPVYHGYGHLASGHGVVGVVVDQPYHDVSQAQSAADGLARIIELVRGLDEVDAGRVAVWVFSGGAMLVGRWLADSPGWLRCLALTYPVLAAEVVGPGRPLILTRVGRELPERQAMVERFLALATKSGVTVEIVDVPDGQHGFDVLDHTEQSRTAVLEATDLLVGHLLR